MANTNIFYDLASQSNNICLFPLRLETRFCKNGTKKELHVRIIPDEILLDYHKKGLSFEEAEDGKRFWIQWYIASGSERREYEAWLNLCAKYPVSRAAWICRCLRPPKFDRYKRVSQEQVVSEEYAKNGEIKKRGVGDLFGHRPFPGITEIENACDRIYKKLGELPIDESKFLHQSNPDDFEDNVTDLCQSMLKDVYEICKNLRQTSIVDYLYDSVLEMANHLKRRLDSINKIYEEHAELKENVTFDQTKDLDYWSLNDLTNVVNEFIRDYKIEYRVSLPDMIGMYKDRMDKVDSSGVNLYFANYEKKSDKDFEIPETSFLPNKFVFIGESVDSSGKKKDYIAYSNEVKRDKIALSINPKEAKLYSVAGNDLKMPESMRWMVDYGAAVNVGMAITVEIDTNVNSFNYIYVLGVKSSMTIRDDLLNLFNGHNYFGKSLWMLDPRVATNIVDDNLPEDQGNLEKRCRYEVEVLGKYINEKVEESTNDAALLFKRLGVDYNGCVGHIYNFDSNRNAETKNAYEILWKKLYPDYDPKTVISNKSVVEKASVTNLVGKFFIEHVRATGNVPSVVIGNLPYGIFPISVYEKLKDLLLSKGGNFAVSLLNDLILLGKKWEELSKNAKRLSSLKGENAEQNYLTMAGQTPYSVSFVQRDELQSALIEKNDPTLTNGKWSILNFLFDSAGCRNQPLKNTDRIYNIEKSDLVKELEKIYGKVKAVNYVTEFMDLLTYRIDAWFSGLLDFILSKKCEMAQIGAYGWIFDLKEKNKKTSNEDQNHFIVAPSIQHALSAAVLRSAYLKSKASKTDSHVCVNLSSMRARQALKLVDGIRSGMSMSVVLGCDLERYMHDAELHGERNMSVSLDKYIYTLRQLFPQIVNVEAKDSRAEDHAMQVINGEALLETIINHDDWTWSCSVHEWLKNHVKDEKMTWLHDDVLKMSQNEREVFFRIIERLMDSYDALNDLLLSEGVHRLVMGDQASFYAIGNFMANGEGGLPDPEILKTPSEHVVVSHKAGIVLPQNVLAPSKPFSLVEPGVDAWIESLVGGMDKICFFVKKTENDLTTIQPYSLKYVGVSASEYLYLSAFPATFINYLETRLRMKTGDRMGKISILESGDEASVSCSSNQLSLEEDSIRIQTIRNLLKKGHQMLPSDWVADIQEDKADEALIDRADLSKRGSVLLDKAKNHLSTMIHWLYRTSVVNNISGGLDFNGEIDDEDVAEAYNLLCDCVEFGLTNSFVGFNPDAFAGQYDKILNFNEHEHSVQVQEDLFHMVQAAKDELEKRIHEFTLLVGSSEEEIRKFDSEKIIEAIQKLTLNNIKIFPKFRLDCKYLNIDSFVTKNDYGDFNAKLNYSSFEQWQDEVAEVRDGMKDIHNLSMLQTALNKDVFNVSILQSSTKLVGNASSGTSQIALVDGDWLGLPVDDESKLRDVDSLVLYNLDKKSFKSANYNSGFIFDGWLEYIPYKKHNAGLVFHCDRPDAEAPQTVLLAVNPGSKWDLDSLRKVLDTSSKMMKLRAVEPDLIYADSELSRIFPLFGNMFGN